MAGKKYRTPPDLPPGLDPVTAGRMGLWLLGKRGHERAIRRRDPQYRVPHSTLASATCCAVLPWRLYETPGHVALLASILDVGEGHARHTLLGQEPLSAAGAERLALWLSDRIALQQGLVDELRAYGAARAAEVAATRARNTSNLRNVSRPSRARGE